MKTILIFSLAFITLNAQDWNHWRGPNHDGSTQAKNLPINADPSITNHWSIAIPGASASTPIVIGDHVYLTAPNDINKQLLLLCYSRKDGQLLWQQTISEVPSLQWDTRSNLASPSPTGDSRYIIALFAETTLACFNHQGQLQWKRQLSTDHGSFATQWTYASSPVLYQDQLLIQVLQRNEPFEFQGSMKGTPGKDCQSYLLSIDPHTGKDQWKQIRSSDAIAESLEAFSTPVIHTHQTQTQILVSGGDCLTSHDPLTGKEIWRWGTWNTEKIGHWRLVPSPVAGSEYVIVCAPKKNPIYAVKLGQTGTLSQEQFSWFTQPKIASSDVSTPAYHNGHFYVIDSDRKTLTCLDATNGTAIWTGEFPSKCKIESSPSIADNKLYCLNFWGELFIVDISQDHFQLLNTIPFGDGSKPNGDTNSVRASVSIAYDTLFFRTQTHLRALSNKTSP
jgi:outer membrane protein assembly factor BamB